MMKTLKYIVLLTVMLVNMTPYIKDGKVEWKTSEVTAQNYGFEINGLSPIGCSLPNSFTFGIQIHNVPVDPMIHNGTSCGFLVLAALIGGNPVDYSLDYILKCNPNQSKGIWNIDLEKYFSLKGVTFNGHTTTMCGTLTTGIIYNYGILCPVVGQKHVFLAYKLSRTSNMQPLENTIVEIFDGAYTGSGYICKDKTLGDIFSSANYLVK